MRYVTIGGALALGLAVLSASVMLVPVAAQQPTFQRKILITQDLPVPGYQIVMAAVEIPPGVRSGRHTHPGTVVANIQEGVLTLEHEGRPTATYTVPEPQTGQAGITGSRTRKTVTSFASLMLDIARLIRWLA